MLATAAVPPMAASASTYSVATAMLHSLSTRMDVVQELQVNPRSSPLHALPIEQTVDSLESDVAAAFTASSQAWQGHVTDTGDSAAQEAQSARTALLELVVHHFGCLALMIRLYNEVKRDAVLTIALLMYKRNFVCRMQVMGPHLLAAVLLGRDADDLLTSVDEQAATVESTFWNALPREGSPVMAMPDVAALLAQTRQSRQKLHTLRSECRAALDELQAQGQWPDYFDSLLRRASHTRAWETQRNDAFRRLLERTTANMSHFVQSLIAACQTVLGEPPVDFEVVGFGSLARREMTPHSDLEFGILLGPHTPADVPYFEAITRALQVKILLLGETVLPSMGAASLEGFYDAATPKGFSVDGLMAHACKWPLGNRHIPNLADSQYFDLIGTPEALAQLQTRPNLDPHLHLASSIRSCASIYSHVRQTATSAGAFPSLSGQYLSIIASNRDAIVPGLLTSLQADLLRYTMSITAPSMEGMMYDVKRDLYRATNLLVSSVAYWDADQALPSSLSGQVVALQLSEDAQHHLLTVLTVVNELRLTGYLDRDRQDNRLGFAYHNSAVPRHSKGMGENLVCRFYLSFLPFWNACYEFSKAAVAAPTAELSRPERRRAVAFLFSSPCFDDCKYHQAIIAKRLMQYDRALDVLRDMTDDDYPADGLLAVRCCDVLRANLCLVKRDYPAAVSFCQQAIAYCQTHGLSRSEYYVGSQLLLIMAIYCLLMDGNVADSAKAELAEKASRACDECLALPQLSEWQLAAALSNSGMIFCDITRDHHRAEELFAESLRVRKRLYSHYKAYEPLQVPIHNEIAISFVNLGQVAFGRAEDCRDAAQRRSLYEEALDLYRHSIAVDRLAKGYPTEELLIELLNMANTLNLLQRYEEAVPLFTECLRICRFVFGGGPTRDELESLNGLLHALPHTQTSETEQIHEWCARRELLRNQFSHA